MIDLQARPLQSPSLLASSYWIKIDCYPCPTMKMTTYQYMTIWWWYYHIITNQIGRVLACIACFFAVLWLFLWWYNKDDSCEGPHLHCLILRINETEETEATHLKSWKPKHLKTWKPFHILIRRNHNLHNITTEM